MGNQGKTCLTLCELKTKKSIHDMEFCFFFTKTEDMRSKMGQNKVGENGYCRNYFIEQSFCHIFPVFPKVQNYRECMEKQYLGTPKNRYQVQIHLSCELELICLVYEGESLEKWSHRQFILL